MPVRYLIVDEWYPVFTLSDDVKDDSNGKAEFSDEELSELQRTTKDFHVWQAKIAERFGVDAPSPSFRVPGAADL